MRVSEAEVLIVGRVSEWVKKTFAEELRSFRGKGVTKVFIHVFSSGGRLEYLEELRDVLLDNMVLSVSLYEHEVEEVKEYLEKYSSNRPTVLIAEKSYIGGELSSLLERLKGIRMA